MERVHEAKLHGKPGKRDIEITSARMVNRSGEWIAREVPPERGTDLYLTLDAEIQDKAYSILERQTAAAIVVAVSAIAAGSTTSYNNKAIEHLEKGEFASNSVRYMASLQFLEKRVQGVIKALREE